MIEVIRDKKQWDQVLAEVDEYDFYHTFDYHKLSVKQDEKFELITFRNSEVLIALPVIKRPIFGSDYYDLTSVYGYAGPLSKGIGTNWDNHEFTSSLNQYFRDSNIVSAFARLNPYIQNQDLILKDMGSIKAKGKVVPIDLTESIDVQRHGYQSRIKTQINKARRNCRIRTCETEDELDEFIAIYNENMDRLNAAPSYYFTKDYYKKLLSSKDFDAEILLAELNESNQIIAGAIFVNSNSIVQYHLSGTRDKYLKLAPIKMLIDEMRLRATNGTNRYLNLGGGYKSQEDSLLRFKMSFSKHIKSFKVWNHVVQKKKYDELCSGLEVSEIDYFPAYRSSSAL